MVQELYLPRRCSSWNSGLHRWSCQWWSLKLVFIFLSAHPQWLCAFLSALCLLNLMQQPMLGPWPHLKGLSKCACNTMSFCRHFEDMNSLRPYNSCPPCHQADSPLMIDMFAIKQHLWLNLCANVVAVLLRLTSFSQATVHVVSLRQAFFSK